MNTCERCGASSPQSPCRSCWAAEALAVAAEWQLQQEPKARHNLLRRLGRALYGASAA